MKVQQSSNVSLPTHLQDVTAINAHFTSVYNKSDLCKEAIKNILTQLKTELKLKINGTALNYGSISKNLGLLVDENLRFKEHTSCHQLSFSSPNREYFVLFTAENILWDDGILDPKDTRKILGLSIVAATNNPGGPTTYGVFRIQLPILSQILKKLLKIKCVVYLVYSANVNLGSGRVSDYINKQCDKGNNTALVLLDFSKVFDTIDH
nr:unnamed protein product [Callosobruchus chinensis]